MTAEGEQLGRQRGSPIRGAHDLEDILAPGVIVVEAGDEELAVAADRGQEVVEVVGDAAGQPSDRFELLRVQELLPEPPLLGDVSIVHDHDPLVVLSATATNRLDRAPRPVAVAEPSLDRPRLLAGEHCSKSLVHGLVVVGMQQRKAPRADDRIGREAEHALDRRALVEARAVGGEDRDHVRGVFDQ